MYLTISGKNKTDPEILHWIAKFLTGPKKTYLVYLMNNYGYRIRLRNPQNKDSGSSTPQPSQPKSIGRSVSLQNLKSDKNAANPIDSSSNSLSTESATGAADPPHNDNNSDAHHSANSLDDSKSNSSSNRNSYDLGQTAPLESWDEEPVPHRPSPVVSPFESPAYMNKLKAFNAKKAKFDIWNEPSPRDREVQRNKSSFELIANPSYSALSTLFWCKWKENYRGEGKWWYSLLFLFMHSFYFIFNLSVYPYMCMY